MTKHILITHEKGGAAVTTTAVNLAAELAGAGWSALVVDCDSRGDVAASLGIDPAPALAAYLTDRCVGREESAGDLVRFGRAGLDVLPTTASGLRSVLQLLDGMGEGSVRQWLRELGDGYDFVLYDAKAASGNLRRVLMQLADLMVIPTRMEALGLPDVALLIEQYRSEGGTAIIRAAGHGTAHLGPRLQPGPPGRTLWRPGAGGRGRGRCRDLGLGRYAASGRRGAGA